MRHQVVRENFDSFYYYSGGTQNWEMQEYHIHKEYEIILFLCDGAAIDIGERHYLVRNGDLFLIHSSQCHKTVGAEGKEYRRYVLMFNPDWVKKISQAMGYDFTKYFPEDSQNSPQVHLSGKRLEDTIRLFEDVNRCSCSDRPKTALELKILELLLHVNQMHDFFEKEENVDREAEPAAGVKVRERAEQIKKYVAEHLDEKLELEDIARRFYISRHYLSHYFKKETGFTLGQYITYRKMDKAKTMLQQGYSVSDTAAALSYQSDSHFISIFKRMTGVTPKKYAAKRQNLGG